MATRTTCDGCGADAPYIIVWQDDRVRMEGYREPRREI